MHEDRVLALTLANQAAIAIANSSSISVPERGITPEAVVDRAKAYLAFLEGRASSNTGVLLQNTLPTLPDRKGPNSLTGDRPPGSP